MIKKILITALLFSATCSSGAYAADNHSPNLLTGITSSVQNANNSTAITFGREDAGASSDTVGISVAKPILPYSDMNASNNMNENAPIQNPSASLVPTGSETDLGFAYRHPVNEKLNTKFELLYRNDANNVSGETDSAAMFHVNYKFR